MTITGGVKEMILPTNYLQNKPSRGYVSNR